MSEMDGTWQRVPFLYHKRDGGEYVTWPTKKI
nr:MAG TPA: hypothetical protein [Caudoviricetes sp.]